MNSERNCVMYSVQMLHIAYGNGEARICENLISILFWALFNLYTW